MKKNKRVFPAERIREFQAQNKDLSDAIMQRGATFIAKNEAENVELFCDMLALAVDFTPEHSSRAS